MVSASQPNIEPHEVSDNHGRVQCMCRAPMPLCALLHDMKRPMVIPVPTICASEDAGGCRTRGVNDLLLCFRSAGLRDGMMTCCPCSFVLDWRRILILVFWSWQECGFRSGPSDSIMTRVSEIWPQWPIVQRQLSRSAFRFRHLVPKCERWPRTEIMTSW